MTLGTRIVVIPYVAVINRTDEKLQIFYWKLRWHKSCECHRLAFRMRNNKNKSS